MTDQLDIEGFCPTIHEDEEISPEFDEEREEYICPLCEVGFGADAEDARANARNHLV